MRAALAREAPRCGRRRARCCRSTRSRGRRRSGRAGRTPPSARFRSRQNAAVIWKSLPWWHMASRKARSRAYSARRRARVGADGLARLAVQVGPERQQLGAARRSAAGCWRRARGPPRPAIRPRRSPGAAARSPSMRWARAPSGQSKALGQPLKRGALGAQPEAAGHAVGRVAPGVVGAEARARRARRRGAGSAAPRATRAGSPGTTRKVGWSGSSAQLQVAKTSARTRNSELVLAIGLHPQAGRAAAPVAEAHGDRVARPRGSRAPTATVSVRLQGRIASFGSKESAQHRAVRRLGRDVVRRRRVGELRRRHVGHLARADADASRCRPCRSGRR